MFSDHPRPDVVAHPARGDIDDSYGCLDELQFRQHAELISELRPADDRMEKRGMGGVHGVFMSAASCTDRSISDPE